MAEKSIFIEFIGDSPQIRIIDYLISVKGLDFSISDIARNAKIGRATLYRVWEDLLKNKIIIETRIIGKSKLYKLNEEDPRIKKLIEIDNMLIIEELKKRAKKQEIIAMH